MAQAYFGSPASIERRGEPVAGGLDRQQTIAGFRQPVYSASTVVCVGAGGLIANVAPALCRKGIGKLIVLDRDVVEPSNLNRQLFFRKDLGENKALSLINNLQPACTAATTLVGYEATFEDALASGVSLTAD